MNVTTEKLPHKLFINGQWQPGQRPPVPVINPATGETLTLVEQADPTDVNTAIQAAKQAFASWSKLAPNKRAQYMNTIADLIEENHEHLARIMTLEQGKPLSESLAEIQSDADNFRWNAAEGQRTYGEIVPSPDNQHWLVTKQPIGVVAAITPWNFPSNMIARKIAPALATGCTLIMKPSKETPLSALALGEIFTAANLPAGVINILLGNSREVGELLTQSPDIQKITFTGSTKVGTQLYLQSAPTLKKVSLELGGHAPFIVFPDANLELAAQSLVAAKFRNNGQVCTAPNRIFLHQQIKDAFIKLLLKQMPEITIGNGLENPTIGPLINQAAVEKISQQLADAKEKGAQILYGGAALTHAPFDQGSFFEPTVLTDVTSEMLIYQEETFGPVIPIIEFQETSAVIEDANDTPYGLAAYLFSNNMQLISKATKELDYGMIGVNEMAISNPAVPFGGVKHSGFGRENGKYGVEEYLEVKFIALKTDI
ncbi:MAG: NAD-dependent succinate-semialdehyde dehydrogenase [Enterococcus sp.]